MTRARRAIRAAFQASSERRSIKRLRCARAPLPLWSPPLLRTVGSGESGRRATWLELFYDLVYVVVIAALAHELLAHPTAQGVARFAALFVPVWWSWVGVTLYNDRFDTDDAGTRLITFLQMLGAAALAVGVHTAFTGPGFALAYVFVRLLLVAQYARVARHAPLARPLALRYATGFTLAASLWLVSVFVPPEARIALWVVAMVIDVGTPLTARALQAKLPLSTSHLPERMGLFTIIVLGEAVAAVVRGIGRLDAGAFAGATLGLSIGFCVWWIYFDNLDEHVVRRTRVAGQVWFYAHLPLAMGIAASAVGVEALIHASPSGSLGLVERWILGGSVTTVLAAMGALHLATREREGPPRHMRRATLRLGAAALALAATAMGALLPPLALGAILAALALSQVAFDPPRVPHGTAS